MLKFDLDKLRSDSLLLPLYLPAVLISVTWGIREPVLPLMIRGLGGDYLLVGMVLSAESIGTLLSDLPSGAISSWLGTKRSFLIGLIGFIFFNFAMTWAGSIQEIIIYRFITGAFTSLIFIAQHTYITINAAENMRGRALASYGGVFRIGRFIGPVLGGFIAARFNFRLPFAVIGILGLLAFISVILFMKNDQDNSARKKFSFNFASQALTRVFSQNIHTFVTVGAGVLFAQMIRASSRIVVPLFAAEVLNLGVEEVGILVSVGAFFDLLLFYPTGLIMDRFGRKFAIVPSFLIQGLGLVLIPLSSSTWMFALFVILIGLGNGLGAGTMMTLGTDFAPKKSRSEFLGLWRLQGDIGGTAGPAIAGAVAGALALGPASIAMGFAGFLASGIFLFLVPETKKNDANIELSV